MFTGLDPLKWLETELAKYYLLDATRIITGKTVIHPSINAVGLEISNVRPMIKLINTSGKTTELWVREDVSGDSLAVYNRTDGRFILYLNNAGQLDVAGYKVDGNVGASGSFTTVDGKTVTVVNGLIIGIV